MNKRSVAAVSCDTNEGGVVAGLLVSAGRRLARGLRLGVGVGVVAACVSLVGPAVTTHAAAAPSPGFIAASADWLTSVNYYRSMSGLAPVAEDPALSPGAVSHSCYMLANGISHDEVPADAGYTAAGDESGNSSNVAVSSAIDASARSFVELWMTGPFHAIGILRPGLRTVGFGRCDQSNTPTWHSGASLDVLHGYTPAPITAPILFPGAGTTTSLNRFVAESPNPLDSCDWTGSAGLPVLAMMPESTVGASATITGPNGPIETCTVSGANSTGTAKVLLDGDNTMVAIPRNPLSDGTYHVTMHTNARTVGWDFTVDQAAADGTGYTPTTPTPAPTTNPSAGTSTVQRLTTARIVDTRINRSVTPFRAS